MSRPKPYVGVSGVVNPEQQAVLRRAALPLEKVGRSLAIGVKAVRKTQWHDTENKYGAEWYPVGEAISGCVVASDDRELRVAQIFLDQKEARQCSEENYEKCFIDKLLGRAGLSLNGIQFDMLPWDSEWHGGVLGHIRKSQPDYKIILQAHKAQMEQHGPSELIDRLKPYACNGLVDYVLFDASHGTGTELDIETLKRFVDEAYTRTNLGVGIAGGLDAGVVARQLPAILKNYPDLSFDAEGKLHINPDDDDRSLNLCTARDYLLASAEAIDQARG